MSRKLTVSEFKARVRAKHGRAVKVDSSTYRSIREPVVAFCMRHDLPIDISKNYAGLLLRDFPCKLCLRAHRLKEHIADFKRAMKQHYTGLKYRPREITDFDQPIEVYCPDHGWKPTTTSVIIFERWGCNECGRITTGNKNSGNQRVSFEAFIEKVEQRFGDSLVVLTQAADYINQSSRVTLKCGRHSEHPAYERTGTQVLKSQGCIYCRESMGERLTRLALTAMDIHFEQEKRFDACRDKNPLPFDFWLPDQVALIEFQGRQHEQPWEYAGGSQSLKGVKRRDRIKLAWAQESGIPLLLIHDYTQISQAIAEFLDTLSGGVERRATALAHTQEANRLQRWNEYRTRLEATHGAALKFDKTYWEPGMRKIDYECSEHGLRNADLFSLLKGHGCQLCAGNHSDADELLSEARASAEARGGVCLSTSYVNTGSDLLWRCDAHHYWLANRDSVVKNQSWCPGCAANHRALIRNAVTKLIKHGYLREARETIQNYTAAYPEDAYRFAQLKWPVRSR